ncbi:MAG TPA: glycosyltransferase family 39 protein [Burkholderiales bacterium]|jgi:4-amino-4-deoxy-L-arabinose transferase-like glycosyltransferase|nr:glycosyltransferase family 39 protein [Burkholderiales bacterium]
MKARWLAALAVATSFFWMLGAAPLFDVDEGAFSQATLEMFERGDFLSTYLNGLPRYDKPILVYWLQAASVALLGPSEWAFRLPSALCATLWAWLTYAFVRKHYGEERALFAAVLLACSLGVYIIGRAATADALLNCLLAAAMFAAWLHLSTGRRRWLYATHAAIALGVLAKGPIAILVPGATTFLFCLLKRNLKAWASAVFDWRGLALFFAIAAPWYAAILAKEGWAFVDGFLLRHNVARFGGPLQGHGGSLLYYFPVLLVLSAPFTALIAPALARLRELWRDDLQAYLLLWFAFVFVFFSLSGTKLPHYVLYGYTGLAILMAARGAEMRSQLWALVPPLVFFVALLALPYALAYLAPRLEDAYYRQALGMVLTRFDTLYFAYFGVATALVVYAMLERRTALARKLALCGLLAVAGLSTLVVPAAGELQEPIKEAALLARERRFDVVMWRLNAPSFSVYRGAPTPSREPRPGDVIVTKASRLSGLPKGTAYDILFSRGGIVLARIKA